MPYDQTVIESDKLCQWEDDDFCVLRYYTRRSGRENDTSRLIWGFKDNDKRANPEAVQLCTKLLLDAVGAIEAELRDNRRCRYIVCAPSSSAGPPGPTAEGVCSALASRFGWLKHLSGILIRTEPVTPAHLAWYGERNDYSTHRRTIRFAGPKLNLNDETIIMFDDLLTRKDTSSACRDILEEATSCSLVIGIYLGRTQ